MMQWPSLGSFSGVVIFIWQVHFGSIPPKLVHHSPQDKTSSLIITSLSGWGSLQDHWHQAGAKWTSAASQALTSPLTSESFALNTFTCQGAKTTLPSNDRWSHDRNKIHPQLASVDDELEVVVEVGPVLFQTCQCDEDQSWLRTSWPASFTASSTISEKPFKSLGNCSRLEEKTVIKSGWKVQSMDLPIWNLTFFFFFNL